MSATVRLEMICQTLYCLVNYRSCDLSLDERLEVLHRPVTWLYTPPRLTGRLKPMCQPVKRLLVGAFHRLVMFELEFRYKMVAGFSLYSDVWHDRKSNFT